MRREDRRTTIFAAGATSASYDASADLIIDPEAFISRGLGFDEEDASFLQPNLASLIAQAEAVVWRTVDQATQPVSLPALTKALAMQVPGLVQANWAGKGTFYALLTSLPLEPLKIDRDINALVDPRRLVVEQRKPRPVNEVPAAKSDVVVASTTPQTSKQAADQAAFESADVGAMLAQELAKSDPRRPPKLPHLWPPKLLHLAGVS